MELKTADVSDSVMSGNSRGSAEGDTVDDVHSTAIAVL